MVCFRDHLKEMEEMALQNRSETGMIRIKDGRIVCPICKRKTNSAVLPNSYGRNIPVFCPHCKQTHIVDINDGQSCIDSPSR